nr:hypothetical protein [Candidatus Electrothrix aestuarii]
MYEFNNRIDAQRSVLEVVNRQSKFSEELCGLSKKALERWISSNKLDPTSESCNILFQISKKLFFLANKSQEQITEEYKALSLEIAFLKFNLEKSLL